MKKVTNLDRIVNFVFLGCIPSMIVFLFLVLIQFAHDYLAVYFVEEIYDWLDN